MAKLSTMSKQERLLELLGHLGGDRITLEQFWALMRQHGYTDDDIDKCCSDLFAGVK